tara:strand:- start:114 stop:638 length:525 start_codon:yes stop_codon:yes gene_type:complete
MSYKKKENLNTTPLKHNKPLGKNYGDFHFRPDGIKIAGKEEDIRECIKCHRILPTTAFTTNTLKGNGAYSLKNKCRECNARLGLERKRSKENAPPKPNRCNCCHKKCKVQGDHIHGSFIFRGWLCNDCNIGVGNLGDTLEGVLQGAIYLEKDKSKIIEILDKVFNETKHKTEIM